jgi:hypothetical protein
MLDNKNKKDAECEVFFFFFCFFFFFFFFFFCPALQPGVGLGLLDDQPPVVSISRPLCPDPNSHLP